MTSAPASAPRLLSIGRITRAHGIVGEVKAQVDPGLVDFAKQIKRVYLGSVRDARKVLGARVHQGAWLLVLQGVTSRNDADALRGVELLVDETDLPELVPGEYYEHDLVGLRVLDLEGRELGVLKEVLVTGSNDVYVIDRPDGGELLLPVITSVVREIDLESGIVRVVVPDGL